MCSECEERSIYARGLCKRCYHRWYMRAHVYAPEFERDDPPRVLRDNRGRKCDYCLLPAASRGLCRPHYKRFHHRGML